MSAENDLGGSLESSPEFLPDLPAHLLDTSESTAPVFLVALLSAGLGTVCAIVLMPTWQVAVESAQVLAGLVTYPPENAFYLYHLKAWTAIHQILGLFLAAGISERALSIALSGVLGAISFVSLSLCTFAMCRNVLLALLAPVWSLAVFGGSDQYGVVYPLYLMGTHHTYGVLGQGLALTTMGLFALGFRRVALLLLGLTPSFHPAWGAWTVAVLALAMVWNRLGIFSQAPKDNKRMNWPWFAAGLACTIASFVGQRWAARVLPNITEESTEEIRRAFITLWDGHRGPVDPMQPGVWLTIAALLVCLAFAFRRVNSSATGENTMVRILFVSAALASAAIVATWLPLPKALAAAMPGRFANLAIVAAPALVLGLLGRYESTGWGRILLAAHAIYPLLNWMFDLFLKSDRFGWRLPHWAELIAAALVLIVIRFAVNLPKPTLRPWWNPLPATMIAVLLAGLIVFRLSAGGTGIPIDDDSDSVFNTAIESSAMIIPPPGAQLIQLRFRRPVLLNTGGLDQVVYVPSSGPEMQRVLEDVYGVEILYPPLAIADARPGALLSDTGLDLWTTRTTEEWQQLRTRWKTAYVLAPAETQLQLPLIARDSEFSLYTIPPPTPDTRSAKALDSERIAHVATSHN